MRKKTTIVDPAKKNKKEKRTGIHSEIDSKSKINFFSIFAKERSGALIEEWYGTSLEWKKMHLYEWFVDVIPWSDLQIGWNRWGGPSLGSWSRLVQLRAPLVRDLSFLLFGFDMVWWACLVLILVMHSAKDESLVRCGESRCWLDQIKWFDWEARSTGTGSWFHLCFYVAASRNLDLLDAKPTTVEMRLFRWMLFE